MLPKNWRMRSSDDFRRTFRQGTSAGNRHLAIHFLTDQHPSSAGLVGFVVPKKASKKAVERNRVKRQLRHIVGSRIDSGMLHGGDLMVVRVFHDAIGCSSDTLAASFDRVFLKVMKKTHQCGEREVRH